MNVLPRNPFLPIHKPVFLKLFLIITPLLAVILLPFMQPDNVAASDFVLIAWVPGQELLTTGSVYADYPYPLWTVVIMLPFVVWEPSTAMVVWFIFNLFLLAASLVLLIQLFDWKITPALIAFTVSFSALFLPVLTSMWIGQLTIFSFFILVLALYLFLHQRWMWHGVALGLSFIKPQVMILLAGLFLLWVLWQRRWQTLLGFCATIGVLILISLPFIDSPGQLIGGGIGSHLGTYILKTSTIWAISFSLGMHWAVPIALSLAMGVWLAYIWLPFLRGVEISSNRFLFLCSAATMVNLIIIPYSWMHNLVLMLLPFGYSLSLILKIKGGVRYVWMGLLIFIVHPLMIGIFFVFTRINQTQAHQIIPALLLLPLMIFLEFQINREKC